LPSPSAAPFSWLLAKEWRELMASRAWWVMLALTGPLVGLSFIGAVRSFSEMSGGAGGPAGLSEALTPLDGIFIPTFGAFDLIATFLLPFVAIRAVSADIQSGAIKILLQQPRVSTRTMVAAKAIVLFVGCLIASLAGALACALWTSYGGATSLPELVNLSLGHALHAALTIAIAVAAAAMTEHPATAAIVALGVTVGTWAYEFISLGRGGWWEALASYMPTAMLRAFEHGLFRVSAVLVVSAITLGGLAIGAIWLRIGVPASRRVAHSVIAAALTAAAAVAGAMIPGDLDVSENRRNSFTEREEAALEAISTPLRINARLAPEDPRRFDLEHGAYAKLRRTMKDVDIVYTSSTATGLFEPQGTGYGEIWYALGEKRVMERSTAEPIIVNTIVELSGAPALADGDEESFSGHPLVAQPVGAASLFYVIWPVASLSAGFFKRKRRPI